MKTGTTIDLNIPDPIQLLEKKVNTSREEDDADIFVLSLVELGQAYLEIGDTPRALTQYEEGIKFCQQTGNELAEARFWGYKGICLMRLGNSDFAQVSFYKSLKMARAIDHKSLIVDALTQLGGLLLDTGKPEKAISKYEQAFTEAMNLGDQRRIMLISSRLGNIFFGLESLEKAVEYYAVALKTAQDIHDKRAECAYQISIGNAFYANDEIGVANEHFEYALNLSMELDDRQVEISALSNLLKTSIAADKISMVLLYGESVVRQAAAIHEQAAEIANIQILTTYLINKGLYQKAFPYLERGLVIAEAQQDWDWQLTMLMNLGYASYTLENLPEAAAYYEQGLMVAEKALNNLAEAQILSRLSAIQADRGDLETAVTNAQYALDLAQQLENPATIGELQMLLAFIYSELAQPEEAIASGQAAANTYLSIGEKTLADQATAFVTFLTDPVTA